MTDFEKITFNQSYYRWNSSGPIRIPITLVNAEEANKYSKPNSANSLKKYIFFKMKTLFFDL